MDRRQRKTREAIFRAFSELLYKKDFSQITVGEIIERADVGRATFYSHFETKDFLLKEMCEELFCHLFDRESDNAHNHRHIFECDSSDAAYLHLLRHLRNNDNNILTLLSSQNNEIFWRYFRSGIDELTERKIKLFENNKSCSVPNDFWKNHIASTFIETLKWWIKGGTKESPETIYQYFLEVI